MVIRIVLTLTVNKPICGGKPKFLGVKAYSGNTHDKYAEYVITYLFTFKETNSVA